MNVNSSSRIANYFGQSVQSNKTQRRAFKPIRADQMFENSFLVRHKFIKTQFRPKRNFNFIVTGFVT